MKKLIIAPLLLAAMFAISSGTGTQPAAAEPATPEIGGCRWLCGSKPNPFMTQRDCERVCTSFCEAVC